MSRDPVNDALTLARAIVAHVPRWEAVRPDDQSWFVLLRPIAINGPAIYVSIGRHSRNEERVEFSCRDPPHKDGRPCSRRDERPKPITMAKTRAPAALAAELRSRLLIPYLDYYQRMTELAKREDAEEDERFLIARRLDFVLGARTDFARDVRGPRGGSVSFHPRGSSAVYKLEVHGATSYRGDGGSPTVDAQLSGLSPETAAEIFAIIHAAEQKSAAVEASASQEAGRMNAEDESDDESDEEEDDETELPRAKTAGALFT